MARKFYGIIVERAEHPVKLGRFIYATIIGEWSDGTKTYQECNEAGEVIDPRTCYSRMVKHGKSFFFVESID